MVVNPSDEVRWKIGGSTAIYLGSGVCCYESELTVEECAGHVIVRCQGVRAVHDGKSAWWIYVGDDEYGTTVHDAQVEALILRRPVPLPDESQEA